MLLLLWLTTTTGDYVCCCCCPPFCCRWRRSRNNNRFIMKMMSHRPCHRLEAWFFSPDVLTYNVPVRLKSQVDCDDCLTSSYYQFLSSIDENKTIYILESSVFFDLETILYMPNLEWLVKSAFSLWHEKYGNRKSRQNKVRKFPTQTRAITIYQENHHHIVISMLVKEKARRKGSDDRPNVVSSAISWENSAHRRNDDTYEKTHWKAG